jgi:hypothetical protein
MSGTTTLRQSNTLRAPACVAEIQDETASERCSKTHTNAACRRTRSLLVSLCALHGGWIVPPKHGVLDGMVLTVNTMLNDYDVFHVSWVEATRAGRFVCASILSARGIGRKRHTCICTCTDVRLENG